MTRLKADFARLMASVARMSRPDQVPYLKTRVLAGETPTTKNCIS
jgi:hypothetical protein